MNAPTRPHDQRELLNHEQVITELDRIGNSDTIFRAQGRIITLPLAYELVTTLPRKSWQDVSHKLDEHKITREMYNALMKISDSIVADYEGEFHPPVAHDASPHGTRSSAPRDLPRRPEYVGEDEFDSMRSNSIITRRKVFELLSRGEVTADTTAMTLAVTYTTALKHLNALVTAGVAHIARTVGRQQFFALGPTAQLTQAPEKPNHAPKPNAQPDQATRATNEQPSTARRQKKIEFRRRNTQTDVLAAPTPPDTPRETHDATQPAEGPMHPAQTAHDATATESEPTLPRHADASAEVQTIPDAPLPYVETPLEQIVHDLRISLAMLQTEVLELRADNARLSDTVLELRGMLAHLLAQRADVPSAASDEEGSIPTEVNAPSMFEPVETHSEHEPDVTVIPIARDTIVEAYPSEADDAPPANDDHDTPLQEHVSEETDGDPETLDVENAPIVHTPPPTTPARRTPVNMRRRRTKRAPDDMPKPKRSRAQTSPTGPMPHFSGDPTRVTTIMDPAIHRDTSLAQHLAKLQMTDAPAVLEAVTTLSKLMSITDKNEKGTALASFYEIFLQQHPSLNKQLLIQWYLLGAPGIAALERACDKHANCATSNATPSAAASSPFEKPRCPGQRFSIDPYATPQSILESRQVTSDDDPIAELLLRLDGNLKQDEWDLYASYAESARFGVINANVRQTFAAMLAKAYPYIPAEHVTQICELMFTTARTPLQDIQWNMYVKQYFTFN